MPGEPKASERRIESKIKQAEALNLKRAGASYRAIADRLGYGGPSGAHKAVMSALKEIIREPAEELVALEIDRLDAMLLGLWSRASKGDPQAVAAVLKIMERRARLLGLDAPEKHQFSGDPEHPISVKLVRD